MPARPCAYRLRGGGRNVRKRLQVERQIVRRMKAALRVLLEAVPDDPIEAGRNLTIRCRQIRRLLREDRAHRVGGRVATEGALPREHLVEDCSEAEDVRARV